MAKRFDVGSRLSEPTYGLGSVIAVEDAYLRIDFDEHGVKKFLTSLATFESSKEPAPSRAGRRKHKTARKRKTAVKSSKTKTTRASRGSAKSKTVKATKKAKASASRSA